MNREQRRKNKIPTPTKVLREPIYTLKKSELDKIKLQATEQAIEQSMTLLLVLPVKVLKEHYGFSRKKLENFCAFISDEYDKLELSEKCLDECRQMLYEEVGVRFEVR